MAKTNDEKNKNEIKELRDDLTYYRMRAAFYENKYNEMQVHNEDLEFTLYRLKEKQKMPF